MDESKSGIAHLKRRLVYEMGKFDNSNTKSAEMMADRIINEMLNKGSHGGLVF